MEKTVQMASRDVLLTIAFIEALAESVRALNLSRRKTVDWLAEVLLEWHNAGGTILDEHGRPIEIDDELIDLIYGNDASSTWPSILKRTEPGSRKRTPRATMAGRLGLYHAAFTIIGRPITIR